VRLSHAALLLCAILLAGCSTSAGPGAHAGEPYIVNSQRTLFYAYGPAQASGPDFAINHGQRVTMLSYSYGYSQIAITETGQSGYVATEDLKPAPPSALPSPSASPGAVRRRRGGSARVSRPPTPAEQLRIPLPEFPESKPPPGAPAFRY